MEKSFYIYRALLNFSHLGVRPGYKIYFRGDWSWNNFYGHSSPFCWIIQEGKRKYVHEVLVNRLFKLVQEKAW